MNARHRPLLAAFPTMALTAALTVAASLATLGCREGADERRLDIEVREPPATAESGEVGPRGPGEPEAPPDDDDERTAGVDVAAGDAEASGDDESTGSSDPAATPGPIAPGTSDE